MYRTSACLLMLLLAGSPGLARTGTTARAADATSAARLAAAYGVITSIYRSPAHNRAVGGVPNSYHLAGRAIDIARRPGVTHRQIAAALEAAGYTLIESLDEGDHSHFAFGAPRAGPARMMADARGSAPAGKPPAPRIAPPRVLADEHGTLLVDLRGNARLREPPKAPRLAGGTARASAAGGR